LSIAQDIHNQWIHGPQYDDTPEQEDKVEREIEEEDLDYDEATRMYERNLERE